VRQVLVLCGVYTEAAEINEHVEVYVLSEAYGESEATGQH